MSVKYTAKECSCWSDYPNKCYKKWNGQWKCVDDYIQVRDQIPGRRKTKCILRRTTKMRLIDADGLKEIIEYQQTINPKLSVYDVIKLIDNAPTVEERPKGERIADISHCYGDDGAILASGTWD